MHEGKIRVKVCGITDISEIQTLKELKVDYAGFIFAVSPRQITVEKAAELSKAAGNNIKIVGVFTEIDLEFINRLYNDRIIDIVQLHSRDLDKAGDIMAPVWVSVSVSAFGSVMDDGYSFAKGIHLDTYDKSLKGGTGRTFNWERAGKFRTEKTLILAGGLNYRNVREALGHINADVVDLNSGAEIITDGIRKKDPGLIKKFIEEVREYEKHE